MITNHAKCTKPFVQIVEKNVKFPLIQHRDGQFIVEIAMQSTSQKVAMAVAEEAITVMAAEATAEGIVAMGVVAEEAITAVAAVLNAVAVLGAAEEIIDFAFTS